MQRIFAVGDIHGCYDRLLALLDRIPLDWSRDQLVFMGDYIDRGPQSFEVVEHLIGLQELHPDIVFLKGNHEQMLADYLSGKDRMLYLYNGGQQTLESYLRRRRVRAYPIPPGHRRFFDSLRLFHETDAFIFVHAGLRQGVPLASGNPPKTCSGSANHSSTPPTRSTNAWSSATRPSTGPSSSRTRSGSTPGRYSATC